MPPPARITVPITALAAARATVRRGDGAGRGRHSRDRRARPGGPRRHPGPLPHRDPAAGRRGRRALLPAAAAVGPGPRRPAAGLEGPPGRRSRPPPCRGPRSTSWTGTSRVIATRNRTLTPGKLNELVHEAMLRCDPDQAAGVEQAALDARGVWFDHRASTATTDLTARLDTLDALDLQTTLGDLAGILARLGDTRPLDQRQATALGLLAHPQRSLDLAHRAHLRRQPPPPTSQDPEPDRRRTDGLAPDGGPERVAGHPVPAHHRRRPRPQPPRGAGSGGAGVGWRGSGRPPWPCSGTGSPGPAGSPCDRCSTSPAATPSTPTTHPAGCGRPWSSATGTACSPAARSTPAPATWTTSPPTSHPTTAAHRARPPRRTWLVAAYVP